eukprot:2996943-Rhodomonas_salina.3
MLSVALADFGFSERLGGGEGVAGWGVAMEVERSRLLSGSVDGDCPANSSAKNYSSDADWFLLLSFQMLVSQLPGGA